MNKKTAAMVLCTVMAAGVLTGCGGAEEKKDGKTTIKYATYSAGPDHLEDLDKMVAEFEKQNPDIKVETEVIGYDDYFTKLQTQASSKTLPDVFEMNYENFNTYAGRTRSFLRICFPEILMNISRKTENYTDLPRKCQMW